MNYLSYLIFNFNVIHRFLFTRNIALNHFQQLKKIKDLTATPRKREYIFTQGDFALNMAKWNIPSVSINFETVQFNLTDI